MTREERRAAIRAYVKAHPIDWPPMTAEQRSAVVEILVRPAATARGNASPRTSSRRAA